MEQTTMGGSDRRAARGILPTAEHIHRNAIASVAIHDGADFGESFAQDVALAPAGLNASPHDGHRASTVVPLSEVA